MLISSFCGLKLQPGVEEYELRGNALWKPRDCSENCTEIIVGSLEQSSQGMAVREQGRQGRENGGQINTEACYEARRDVCLENVTFNFVLFLHVLDNLLELE